MQLGAGVGVGPPPACVRRMDAAAASVALGAVAPLLCLPPSLRCVLSLPDVDAVRLASVRKQVLSLMRLADGCEKAILASLHCTLCADKAPRGSFEPDAGRIKQI